jgi:hypothetical protein
MALCPDGHQSSASDYCDVCGLAIGGSVPASSSSAGTHPSARTSALSGEPCPNCLLPRTDDPFCEGCGYDFATASPVRVAAVVPPVTVQIASPPPSADPPSLAATAPYSIDLEHELELAESGNGAVPSTSQTAQAQPGPSVSGPVVGSAATPTPVRWTAVAAADRVYYDAVIAEGEIDPNKYPFPPYCPERRFPVSGDTVRIGRSSASKNLSVEIDLTGPPTDPGVSHLHAVLQARPDGGWSILDPGSTNGTMINDDTAPIPENLPVPVDSGYRIHVGVWTTLTLLREP